VAVVDYDREPKPWPGSPTLYGHPASLCTRGPDVTRASPRPALRVLGPGEADRQALLDEWVLRQRAGGLSAKTIRERIGVLEREWCHFRVWPVSGHDARAGVIMFVVMRTLGWARSNGGRRHNWARA
jgi:hypothetical protein